MSETEVFTISIPTDEDGQTGDLPRSGYFPKKRKPPFMKMKRNPDYTLSRHGQRQWKSTEAETIR